MNKFSSTFVTVQLTFLIKKNFMETITKEKTKKTNYLDLIHELGKDFEKQAPEYDQNDQFVTENYLQLKEHGFFSAMIPEELGGGGVSHSEMCEIIREMAKYCSSTALAFSMHQHLIAANVWKYLHNKGGDDALKKIAQKNLVLVSTGARDWLESNGTMEKTEGGYLLNAQKHFASQSTIGDILVTSATFKDPENGWQVLHFPVPMKSEGVTILDNWYTLGMRATGSHTVKLENVFIPESSVVLRRPHGEYHDFWNVVLTVALPLIMAAYRGIAEKAAEIGVTKAKDKVKNKPHLSYLTGEMNNFLSMVQIIHNDMVRITNNFDFKPENELGIQMLTRKTLVANACINTVNKAMEIVGGQSFFRQLTLERLFRDVQAGVFHPLPEKQQQQMTGKFILEGKML